MGGGLTLFAILGVSMFNGMLPPFKNIAKFLIFYTWPFDFLPREEFWLDFQALVLAQTATLLVSGVPAALYERVVRPPHESQVSNYVWLAGAGVLLFISMRLSRMI